MKKERLIKKAIAALLFLAMVFQISFASAENLKKAIKQ